MKILTTPISNVVINNIKLAERIDISGYIFAGRDAVLPKVVSLSQEGKLGEFGIDLKGAIIFHTAVSPAGVGPTSSNKFEIESSIPELSKAGVKIHLGKGAISKSTIEALNAYNSAYAIIPPVTALLNSKIIERRVIAFPEEGIEAFHLLKVERFQVVVAAIHGESLYADEIVIKK